MGKPFFILLFKKIYIYGFYIFFWLYVFYHKNFENKYHPVPHLPQDSDQFQPLRDEPQFANLCIALRREVLDKLYFPWFKETMGSFVLQM